LSELQYDTFINCTTAIAIG